jgi:hypothetical protein
MGRWAALLAALWASSVSAQVPPTYTNEDLRKESPPPPRSALAEFAERWKGHGRRLAADQSWLAERRILIVAEPDVPLDVAPRVAVALREQLAELGSTRLTVEHRGASKAFTHCREESVLDTRCFGLFVPTWRKRDGPAGRAIVVAVTNAGLGSLPVGLPGGHGYGPPAGVASWPEGWVLLSEYYLRLNSARLEPRVWAAFSDHARSNTARHELVHILGLPHHEHVDNPGLPEPPEGAACPHVVGPPPKAECLMRCGSGDDDWGHLQTHGRGFGLCARCRLAAASALAGIEGR